jgi:1,4-dihydroxy-2-naphthoyl-CoA hydrolase
MSIWFSSPSLAHLNAMAAGTIHEPLEIKFIEFGDDYVKATMPVDKRTAQPAGLGDGRRSTAISLCGD